MLQNLRAFSPRQKNDWGGWGGVWISPHFLHLSATWAQSQTWQQDRQTDDPLPTLVHSFPVYPGRQPFAPAHWQPQHKAMCPVLPPRWGRNGGIQRRAASPQVAASLRPAGSCARHVEQGWVTSCQRYFAWVNTACKPCPQEQKQIKWAMVSFFKG